MCASRASDWKATVNRAAFALALLTAGMAMAESAEPAQEATVASRANAGGAALAALELEARREALETLQRDVEAKVEALRKLREEAEANLQKKEREGVEDFGKLVKFYEAMKAKNAARLLEELPLDVAADVVSSMKARQAGKILNAMKAGRAVQISRRMAGEKK